jgi:hypothetical protein
MNMLRTMNLTIMMLAISGGLSSLAVAQQTYSAPPVYSLPPGGLVQVQENQGIRYVSGGVGASERAELRALSSQFNLRLLFAMQGSGNYLADVRVNIMDQNGRPVLDAEADGPWFFAQLPPGSYQVRVSNRNEIQQKTVRIRDSRQARLNFYWRG